MTPVDDSRELFDVVDERGRIVGTATRAECHGDPRLLHRTVHVMVISGKGEFLLQKRSRTKDIQPGRWDTAVGGHVNHGEEPTDAALRETTEELGVRVEPRDLSLCYAYVMRNEIESELVITWTMVHDGPFRADPDEIEDLHFWHETDILSAVGTGVLTPNFEEEFERFRAWRSGRSRPEDP